VWQDFARVEGYQPSGFISAQNEVRGCLTRAEAARRAREFEASGVGAAAKSGDVVFAAVTNALDQTMHSQAFEMWDTWLEQAGKLPLDVEMAKASSSARSS